MRSVFFSTILAILSFSVTAEAGSQPVVVELFTSQGCSSCPPADRVLTQLAGRDDVIALALHVDYWDYLGWKDDFAKAAFTHRQRAYAEAAHKSTVYTPQMIIQGVNHVVGSRSGEVKRLVAAHGKTSSGTNLTVSRDGDMLSVVASNSGAGVGRAIIHLVRYAPLEIVSIKSGENAGRRIAYTNTVTSWRTLAKWNGKTSVTIRTMVHGKQPVVVLVQRAGYGPILAAQRLR